MSPLSESLANILNDHIDNINSTLIPDKYPLNRSLFNGTRKKVLNNIAYNLSSDYDDSYDPYSESEEYSETRNFERILSIVVPLIFGLIVVIGLVGNSLVVCVVLRNRHFRSATNLLIGSLAVADLSFVLICVPFTGTQYALAQWPFSDLWCRCVQYMINVCAYASVYTLVSMSVVRYIVVVYPMKSMYLCTTRRTIKVILAVWVNSFLLNVPVFFIFHKYNYEFGGQNRSACIMMNTQASRTPPQIFYSVFFVGTFVAPISAICVLYIILLRALWGKNNQAQRPLPNIPHSVINCHMIKSRRAKLSPKENALATLDKSYHNDSCYQSFSNEVIEYKKTSNTANAFPLAVLTKTGNSAHLKNKRKVTKLTVIVVVVFALCWLPIHIMLLIQYYSNHEFGPAFQPILVAANCLAYMNSCMNPILYSFLSRSFYTAFLELLCPGLVKRRNREKLLKKKIRKKCNGIQKKSYAYSKPIKLLNPAPSDSLPSDNYVNNSSSEIKFQIPKIHVIQNSVKRDENLCIPTVSKNQVPPVKTMVPTSAPIISGSPSCLTISSNSYYSAKSNSNKNTASIKDDSHYSLCNNHFNTFAYDGKKFNSIPNFKTNTVNSICHSASDNIPNIKELIETTI
ncbi:unnamed protein product [Gordionus sp. m RMFG-2023]|uniref:galanin-like G-protein coupled receptor npr-9 n=1 Tax=Gordionus sp. m RMFG-2023 TaxID=3053472 RepID=UPI0030E198F6